MIQFQVSRKDGTLDYNVLEGDAKLLVRVVLNARLQDGSPAELACTIYKGTEKGFLLTRAARKLEEQEKAVKDLDLNNGDFDLDAVYTTNLVEGCVEFFGYTVADLILTNYVDADDIGMPRQGIVSFLISVFTAPLRILRSMF